MGSVKEKTVEGIRNYFAEVRSLPDCVFSLLKFNSFRTVFSYHSMPAAQAPENIDYTPDGMTPLYDAIGHAISSLASQLNAGDKAVLVIQTDGHENYSKEFTKADILKLISDKRSQGWQVLFLGTNIDVYGVAESLGVDRRSTMQYADKLVDKAFQGAGAVTRNFASGVSGQAVFSAEHRRSAGDNS